MPDRETEKLAHEAATTAVDRARASGGQLALFDRPEPGAPVIDQPTGKRKPGRPAGARNKVKTALRELLAARGYRDPASQLAHMAGLNSTEDPRLIALGLAEAILDAVSPAGEDIARAERLLAKAESEGTASVKRQAMTNLIAAETAERNRRDQLPSLTTSILKIMASAAGDLMPYVFSKVTPDDPQQGAQMVVQIAAPGGASVTAKRVGPPPMPTDENQGNQGVSTGHPEGSDGDGSDGMPNHLEPKGKSE